MSHPSVLESKKLESNDPNICGSRIPQWYFMSPKIYILPIVNQPPQIKNPIWGQKPDLCSWVFRDTSLLTRVIVQRAYSSDNIQSTFRFRGQYSLLPLNQIPTDQADRLNGLCLICHWTFLSYEDFMTRAFSILDEELFRRLGHDSLLYFINHRYLSDLDMDLAARAQWFPGLRLQHNWTLALWMLFSQKKTLFTLDTSRLWA